MKNPVPNLSKLCGTQLVYPNLLSAPRSDRGRSETPAPRNLGTCTIQDILYDAMLYGEHLETEIILLGEPSWGPIESYDA